ncbi:MAG TPA: hypothetical protein VF416_08805 [Marmoricola sp.]
MHPSVGGGTEALVAEIADALASTGEYVRRVESGPTQHVVDLLWCAHRAGKRVGMKVHVSVAEPPRPLGSGRHQKVTLTVVARNDAPQHCLP